MEECQAVHLQPLTHQVGGHTHMFVYDSSTVCKPLWDREYMFYSTIPNGLVPFTPAFKGVIEVEAEEDRDADTMLEQLPQWLRKQSKSSRDVDCLPYNGDNRNYLEKHSNEPESVPADNEPESVPADNEPESVPADSLTLLSIRHHKHHLDQIQLSDYKGRKFILLENVVSKLHRPCVLDLKMGTRQHSDKDDQEKRELKERRCIASTSAKLGVRLGGMQVYQVDSGDYLRRDKYYGRLLTEDGLRDALCEFLNNGERVRVELIDLIIERLQVCYSAVNELNSYRFFGSSLLIIYDGAILRNGLFVDDRGDQNIALPSSLEINTYDRVRHGAIVEETQTATEGDTSPILSLGRDGSRKISHVDVRLVDFANTTSDFLQSDHANCNQGPDTGILVGLKSLIRMFGEVKRQEFQPKIPDTLKTIF